MADAVVAAKAGQKTPDGYDNMARMLAGKGEVRLCGACTDVRGLTDGEMMEGVRRGATAEMAAASIAADKALVV